MPHAIKLFLGALLLNALMASNASATVVFDGFFDYEFDSASYRRNPYVPPDTGGTLSVGFSYEFEHGLNGSVYNSSTGFVGGTITSVYSSKYGNIPLHPEHGTPTAGFTQVAVNTDTNGGYSLRPIYWSFDHVNSYAIVDSERLINPNNVNEEFSDLFGYDRSIPFPYGIAQIGYRYAFKEARITGISELHTHDPEPGSTPQNPLLPVMGPVDSTLCANRPNCIAIPLTIAPSGLGEAAPVFIDPVVATGYEYAITGASDIAFDSVLIPEQGGLVNGDLLELLIGSSSYDLLVGTVFNFFDDAGGLVNLTEFIIQGIDPALGLDPNDPNAFVTGLTFEGLNGQSLAQAVQADILMTALTTDTDSGGNNTGNVPEPGTILLIGLGLAGLRSSRPGKR